MEMNNNIESSTRNAHATIGSEGEGRWIPILDYAVNKGVSLSTLRRYIKANKVMYRMENGRYLLWEDSETKTPLEIAPKANPMLARSGIGALSEGSGAEVQRLQRRVDELQSQLNYAHEQINELKMLVAIYEEQIQGS